MDSYEESLEIEFRKQEGIFYSPNEITEYLVNQVFSLLEVSDFEKIRNLKILDPACGTGVFLEESFDFLLTFYQRNFPNFQNPAKWIVENHLYGVDLDEKAVQICQKRLFEKSGVVSNHIKIGNSLIDDKNLDPKAFDWKKEFPQVFENPENQGFTIIIGNPPYVSANNMSFAQRQYFNHSEQYKHLQGKWDLFMPFFEKAFSMLQTDGILSFIVPYALLNQPFAGSLRKWILEDFSLRTLVDLHEVKVFEAATVPTCIPVIYKTKNLYDSVRIVKHRLEGKKHVFYESHTVELAKYRSMENYMIRTEKLDDSFDLLNKIKAKGVPLGELFYVSTGAEIHGKEQRSTEGELTSGYSRSEIIETENKYGLKPFLEGSAIPKSRELGRYCAPQASYYLDYEGNFDRMRSPKFKALFENPKIMIRKVSGLLGILATFDEGKFYTSEGMIIVTDFQTVRENKNTISDSPYPLKCVLALLNSQIMHFYYTSVYGGFVNVFPNYVKSLPILSEIPAEIGKQIIEKVDILLLAHQNLAVLERNFIKVLKSQFGLKKPSERLELWYKLEWETFTQEMKKVKSPIPTKKEFEWIGLFEEKRQEALSYLSQIAAVEKLLDRLLYTLYGLSETEIKMIEN